MNKKLLAAAVVAAVAASPAAFAESTVYGKIHTSIDADFELRRYRSARSPSNYTVDSRASRLGFKGSEDLGNGLKAIYQIEFGIRSDGGQDQTTPAMAVHRSLRNTFVGLSGDWGTVLVGRHDTPMKMAFYAAGNERPGRLRHRPEPSDSHLEHPIGVFQEFRANNAIAYVSPNFSGFTVAAAIIPGEESGNDEPLVLASPTALTVKMTRDGIADHYSVGAMYKGNGLKVCAGYEHTGQPGWCRSPAKCCNDDQKTWQVGATYTMNNFKFGAQYQDTDNYGFLDRRRLQRLGRDRQVHLRQQCHQRWSTPTPSSTPDVARATSKTDGWGLAAEHNFSKRTKVYAAYAANKDDRSSGTTI